MVRLGAWLVWTGLFGLAALGLVVGLGVMVVERIGVPIAVAAVVVLALVEANGRRNRERELGDEIRRLRQRTP